MAGSAALNNSNPVAPPTPITILRVREFTCVRVTLQDCRLRDGQRALVNMVLPNDLGIR
jgi:hypothetical protein